VQWVLLKPVTELSALENHERRRLIAPRGFAKMSILVLDERCFYKSPNFRDMGRATAYNQRVKYQDIDIKILCKDKYAPEGFVLEVLKHCVSSPQEPTFVLSSLLSLWCALPQSKNDCFVLLLVAMTEIDHSI
jgi:hypothetical protein